MSIKMIKSFVDSLSEYSILLLRNLMYKSNLTNKDILYLKNCYYESEIIEQFFKYYKSLPVDVQEEKYFNSIIYHYKTIYLDYLLYTKKINRRLLYLEID